MKTKHVTSDCNVQEVMSEDNCLYIIEGMINLHENTMAIPSNCSLMFENGGFANGMIVMNDTSLLGIGDLCNCSLQGSIRGSLSSSLYAFNQQANMYDNFVSLFNNAAALNAPVSVEYGIYSVIRDGNRSDKIYVYTSVNFNGSTIRLINNSGSKNFQLFFTNCTRTTADDGVDILNILFPEPNTSRVFSSDYRNTMMYVRAANEVEIKRDGVETPFSKEEFFYIDHKGYIVGDIFNKKMGAINNPITVEYYSPNSESFVIENLNIETEYGDSFNNNDNNTDYRYHGIGAKGAFNLQFRNVTFNNHDIDSSDTQMGQVCFYIEKAYNVCFNNVKVTRTRVMGADYGSAYAFYLMRVNKVTFDSVVTESLESNCWGDIGSDCVQDMNVINSSISRIDGHWRLHNLTVTNCRLSQLTYSGYGLLNVSNCIFDVYKDNTCVIMARGDYQSLFDGDVNINNCIINVRCSIKNDKNIAIIGAPIQGHDYNNANYRRNNNTNDNDPIPAGGRHINIDGLNVNFLASNPGIGKVYLYHSNMDGSYMVNPWNFYYPDIKINRLLFNRYDTNVKIELRYIYDYALQHAKQPHKYEFDTNQRIEISNSKLYENYTIKRDCVFDDYSHKGSFYYNNDPNACQYFNEGNPDSCKTLVVLDNLEGDVLLQSYNFGTSFLVKHCNVRAFNVDATPKHNYQHDHKFRIQDCVIELNVSNRDLLCFDDCHTDFIDCVFKDLHVLDGCLTDVSESEKEAILNRCLHSFICRSGDMIHNGHLKYILWNSAAKNNVSNCTFDSEFLARLYRMYPREGMLTGEYDAQGNPIRDTRYSLWDKDLFENNFIHPVFSNENPVPFRIYTYAKVMTLRGMKNGCRVQTNSSDPLHSVLTWSESKNAWLNLKGDAVGTKYKGTFNEKPISPSIGFAYYCTDRNKMIFYKGQNASSVDEWVDASGNTIV